MYSDSLCCTAETNTTLYSNYIPIKKEKKNITVKKKKKKGTKAVEAGTESGKAESAHLGVYSAVSEGSAEILLTLNRIHMAKSGCPPQSD